MFQVALAGTLTLLAASGRLSVAAVATIVLLAGCAFAVAMPAVQAMTPDLVGPDDLLGAMSLGAAQFNLGRVVGPALAGLVIAAGSLAWAFGLNTLSFGAVLVALALIRLPPPAQRAPGRVRVLRTIAQGMGAARRDPGIRTALLLLLATTFLVSPFIGLVPAVAIKVFHRGATGTSALVTAQGVGAVCSALAAGPLAGMLGRRRLLVTALLLVGPAAVAYGLAPAFPLAVAGIALLGFVYLAVLSGASTVCQVRAPRELRARMASLFMLGVGGGHATGLVVQGWLGDRVGLPAVTAATGLLLLGVVVAVRLLRPDLLAAMDDPAAVPSPLAPPTAAAEPPVPAVPPGAAAPAPAPSLPDASAAVPAMPPDTPAAAAPVGNPAGSTDVHALQAEDGQAERGQGDHGREHGRADRPEPDGEVDAAAGQDGGEHALGVAADGERRRRGGHADHRPLPEQGVHQPDEHGAGHQQ